MESDEHFGVPASFGAVESRFAGICPIPLAMCSERDGRFIEANSAMFTLLGARAAEVLGRTDLELNLWPNEPLKNRGVAGVAQKLPVRNLEVRLRSLSGHIRTVLLSIEPVASAEGMLLVSGHDITEYDILQRKLRSEQKFEALGQFAAGFAHDFNNLLAVVQGYSSILAEMPGAESVKRCAHALNVAAERGATLTRQLMLFSGRQVMEMAEADLNDVLREVSTLVKRLLGPAIAIDVQPAEQPLLLQCDPKMIQQVLLAMAANSKEAIEAAGSFSIKVDSHIAPGSGAVARITIHDSGCGMSQDSVQKVFEPFFTTREVGRGCGLALSAAYGIIKRHQGWIEVSSGSGAQANGCGTTFQIFLPLIETATVNAKPGEQQNRGARPKTILLVEDEGDLRVMVQNILQGLGYGVLTAANGVEALRLWNENEADLLLTDMVMPEGMSGSELAAQLKAARPDLKIVYTSGYSLDLIAHPTEPLVEGENFLQKPYLPQTLAETLIRALTPVARAA